MIVAAVRAVVAERLSSSLSVSLTDAEKADVAAKAKAAGLSMSAYARRKITT